MSRPFIYTPLATDTPRIRCLHILPGTLDMPLRCGLTEEILGPETPFIALSYTWGDTSIRTNIELLLQDPLSPGKPLASFRKPFNEQSKVSMAKYEYLKLYKDTALHDTPEVFRHTYDFEIHANLATALRYLRSETVVRVVWADGICINQADNAEKVSQVRLMADIYRKCVACEIWLGEEADNSGLAMDLIDEMERISLLSGDAVDDPDLTNMYGTFMAATQDWHDHWTALTALVQRPWFTRRWIIQEFVLSKRKIYACGRRRTQVYQLLEVCEAWITSGQQRDERFEARTWELKALQSLSIIPEHELIEKKAIVSLCSRFFRAQCGDPRDIVYSLLSFASDMDEQFEVSYEETNSVVHVFFEVFWHWVNTKKNLDILLYSSHRIIGEAESYLPCFGIANRPCCGPNWSSMHKPRSHTAYWTRTETPVYRAGGSAIVDQSILFTGELELEDGVVSRILIPSGFVYDTVIRIGPALADRQRDDAITIPQEWLNMILQTMDRQTNGGDPSEASPIRAPSWQMVAPEFWTDFLGNRVVTTDSSDNAMLTAENIPPDWAALIAEEVSSPDQFRDTKDPTRLAYRRTAWHQRNLATLFLTTKGYGFTWLGPEGLAEGDMICVLAGCSEPVILNADGAVNEDGEVFYLYKGGCYVGGLMEGEFFNQCMESGTELEEFPLI